MGISKIGKRKLERLHRTINVCCIALQVKLVNLTAPSSFRKSSSATWGYLSDRFDENCLKSSGLKQIQE